MSYSKFNRDIDNYLSQNRQQGVSFDSAMKGVRDKWLAEGRKDEVIAFVLENWDSGNPDDFIEPIENALISEKDFFRFKKLWRSLIRRRLQNLWRYCKPISAEKLSWRRAALTPTWGFNPYHARSYENIYRAIAYQRRFTLRGLMRYKTGLVAMGPNFVDPWIESTSESVRTLSRPTLPPARDRRKIEEPLFWELIQQARTSTAEDTEFIETLRSKLADFSVNQLPAFQGHLERAARALHTWDHWALAYFVRGGCGNDAFDYFKYWCVSLGQEKYAKLLRFQIADISELKLGMQQLEELAYVAPELYEERTEKTFPHPRLGKLEITGQPWTEDTVRSTYPAWSKLFDS